MKRSIELQPKLSKLPTDAEIVSHRGFPSVTEELRLRQNFFDEFEVEIRSFLAEKVPQWRHTLEDFRVIMHFFYGVYLANYILGGEVINTPKTGIINSLRNFFFGGTTKINSSKNINEWPISEVYNTTDINKLIGVSSQTRKISLPINFFQFWSTGSKDIQSYPITYQTQNFPEDRVPLLKYFINASDFAILAGLEEAHHIFRMNFEEKKFNGKKDRKSKFEYLVKIKIKNYFIDERKTIQEFISNQDPQWLISYCAINPYEYAAHLFISECVKRYLLEVWNSGYENFHKLVTEKHKSGPIPRSKFGLHP